jgi:hypothetical protein
MVCRSEAGIPEWARIFRFSQISRPVVGLTQPLISSRRVTFTGVKTPERDVDQ